ncbi:MAG: hypothetical protein IH941_01545 [Acidobacteria bacterium]|nr:hypothetical protein [Acidobacteriota bacterium]
MPTLLEVARDLSDLLDEIEADSAYADSSQVGRAKALHMQLAPVYRQIYGSVPLMITEYPPHVWMRRVREWVSQALAALESGFVVDAEGSNTNDESPVSVEQPPDTSTSVDVVESADVSAAAPLVGAVQPGQVVFVIGPIGDEHAPIGSEPRDRYEKAIEVLEQVIQPACEEHGLQVLRADTIGQPGEIPDQIFRHVMTAPLVIADLTGANPNVMYELAIRHLTNGPSIQIAEYIEGGSRPFDVGVIRTLDFARTPNGLISARNRLSELISSLIVEGASELTVARVWREVFGGEPQAPRIDNAVSDSGSDVVEGEGEDEPGFLELLADMEEAFDVVNLNFVAATEVMGRVTSAMQDATAEISASDAAGRGSKGRLTIAVSLAQRFDTLADELEPIAVSTEEAVNRTRGGANYLLSKMESGDLADGVDDFDAATFVSSTEKLAQATEFSRSSSDSLQKQLLQLGKIARPLRSPVRRLTDAFGRFSSIDEPAREWRDRAAAALS